MLIQLINPLKSTELDCSEQPIDASRWLGTSKLQLCHLSSMTCQTTLPLAISARRLALSEGPVNM